MSDWPRGWTSEFYHRLVPKDPAANLRFRRRILQLCYENPEFREEIWIICSRDILFYLNTFVWILEPRAEAGWGKRWFGNSKKIPFITRPHQDRFIQEIIRYAGRRDIRSPKSREEGASWILSGICDWLTRFGEQIHIGLVSKDEKALEESGKPGSLLGKFDFIDANLPIFLKRPRDRSYTNHTIMYSDADGGSTITGFAPGGDVATGDRFFMFVMDEAHKFPAGIDYVVQASLQHTTPCRWYISTVSMQKGPSGAFYDICQDEMSDVAHVPLWWWDNPEKAAGMYTSDSKTETLKIFDRNYKFPENYKFVLDGRRRSPYYDWECRRPGATSRAIAAELDGDFGGAGARRFDQTVLDKARESCEEPAFRGVFQQEQTEAGFSGAFLPRLIEKEHGGWVEAWMDFEQEEPDEDDPVQIPVLKCPDGCKYSIGLDTSAGTGGSYSSYSAMFVIDWESGEQVAQIRVGKMQPYEFAYLAFAVGKFFNWALLCPEANGPGGQFIDQILKLNYPNLYLRKGSKDSLDDRSTIRVGYWNDDGGEELFQEVQDAIRTDKLKIRSEACVREFERYFLDEMGKLKHPLVGRGRDNAPERSHGDVAIAAGCAWYAIRDIPLATVAPEPEIPADCYLAKKRAIEEKSRKREGRSYWSPTFGR